MKVLLVACFALLTVASGFPTVSQWTLNELSDALQSSDTHPLMIPYLESALDNMMTAIFHGYDQQIATIVIPADVAAAMDPVIVEPVIVEPVLPEEVVPSSPVSPMVQIILNINTKQASVPVSPVDTLPIIEVPAGPVVTLPIEVPGGPVVTLPIEGPIGTLPIEVPIAPEQVGVAILPEVVDVAVLPETVEVANPVNPIDQVAVEPMPVNPIDQVAIEAMPVNPVDIIAPIGVVGPSTDGIHV